MEKFTEKTTLDKLLSQPELIEILAKFKLPCLWCPMAQFEVAQLQIGQVCQVYQIDAKKLLKELNRKAEIKDKKKKK